MKEINHFIQEKLTINKNTKIGFSKEEINELAKKLYQKFGRQYGEFENIKNDHKFHFCVMSDDTDELDYYKKIIPKEIFDTAEIEESNQGAGETFYYFKLDDIIVYYSSVNDAFNDICKWFSYLK